MHKVFGKKENVEYTNRKGAYLIAFEDDKVAVVRTAKGYFLLGGGNEPEENDEETIKRECLEEVGFDAVVGKFVCSAEMYGNHPKIGYFHPVQNYYLGKLTESKKEKQEADHSLEWVTYNELKGKLFVEMQNWALEQCWKNRV